MVAKAIALCLVVLFVSGCCSTQKKYALPLELEFGFMPCGEKVIESEGKEEKHKVYCVTAKDKELIELYYILNR